MVNLFETHNLGLDSHSRQVFSAFLQLCFCGSTFQKPPANPTACFFHKRAQQMPRLSPFSKVIGRSGS